MHAFAQGAYVTRKTCNVEVIIQILGIRVVLAISIKPLTSLFFLDAGHIPPAMLLYIVVIS